MMVYGLPSRKNVVVNDNGENMVLKYIDKSTSSNALYIGTYWITPKQHITGLQLTAAMAVICFVWFDKFVNGRKPTILPSTVDNNALPDVFSRFFSTKIDNLHVSLNEALPSQLSVDIPVQLCSNMLTNFLAITPQTTRDIIMNSSTKSCALDPLPTCILKECLDVLVIPITSIINSSVLTGQVPSSLKTAKVTPIIKKTTLDPEVLNNYRPISNIPFLIKTIERVIAQQIHSHLMVNNLYSEIQSAYRKHHSTETALLRVQNDILQAVDQGYEVILVLLDFTAAFDIIDHSILLTRLERRFGISGNARKWLASYLEDRTQFVTVNNLNSTTSTVKCGVPQGSVLGPLLFSLYVAPMEDLFRAHGIGVMVYADDTQLYLVVKPDDRTSSINKLEKCVQDIKTWTINNKLILNNGKTEIIHIYSNFTKHAPTCPDINIGNVTITPKTEVRDLGVIIDKHLSFRSQINNVCKSAFFALHNIRKIRKYLDSHSTERLIHAFISSRIDNCNSLFYGLPAADIAKLQRVQNAAARLVTGSKRSEHITPILRNLHWLPVYQRIKFKTALLVYKALNDMSPNYIKELIVPYTPARRLRSCNKGLLEIPRSRTSSFGDRMFSVAAPRLWNSFPDNIRLNNSSISDFKRSLKTYFF